MAKSRARPQTANRPSALRIIGGRYRGRKLPVADVAGLRPTGDRIRETLFNWLAPAIVDARCLDLFAGTGALGFEALSRGAARVVFCERDAGAARAIADNLALLGAREGQLHRGDALAFLDGPAQPFDLVFLDPPFAADLWQSAIDKLAPWLADGALVYIESDADSHYRVPEHWRLHRNKRAARVGYRLYRVESG